ncbi:hypothetical protein [Novosphingobium endophyticum]|nr:hypothetical protein [Novosphingobium endophyticum]
MAVDRETCRAGHAPGRAGEQFAGFPAAPDWRDLRSRLFAVYEVRTALAGDGAPARLRTRGSFADDTAALLNTYEISSRPVNLEVSSNGKSDGGKVTPVTGKPDAGERG